MPRQMLTPAQVRRLEALERRAERAREELDRAEAAWAAYVREVGQAAVARRLGVSDQALSDRLRRIERRVSRPRGR